MRWVLPGGTLLVWGPVQLQAQQAGALSGVEEKGRLGQFSVGVQGESVGFAADAAAGWGVILINSPKYIF